jgi:hypothetical protein
MFAAFEPPWLLSNLQIGGANGYCRNFDFPLAASCRFRHLEVWQLRVYLQIEMVCHQQMRAVPKRAEQRSWPGLSQADENAITIYREALKKADHGER